MYKVHVISALLYAAETWVTTSTQEDRLAALYNAQVRQICGVKWWHFRTNEDVLAAAELPSFRLLLASRRLRWVGHLHRMDPKRMTRTFLPAIPMLNDIHNPTRPHGARYKRKAGGQRKTYTACALSDLQKMAAHHPNQHPQECINDRGLWRAFINPFPTHPPNHSPTHSLAPTAPTPSSDDR
jgi:hypothetical protein